MNDSWQIDDGAFNNLDSLAHFNLSNCFRFSFDLLYRLFENPNIFPKLKAINLNDLNRYRYGSQLDLNASFIDFLGKRGLTDLSADRIFLLQIFLKPTSALCSSIRKISFRNTRPVNIKFSSSTGTCYSLEYIDLSGLILFSHLDRVNVSIQQVDFLRMKRLSNI